jgi:gliding motility-associated lipoprotein GldH
MKRSYLPFSISIFMSVVLLACETKPFFSEKKMIDPRGWAYTDTLDFSFQVTDTSKRYEMDLQVEWADSFKHQNLYLKLGTKFPEGKYLQVVRPYDLFDAQGLSLGKCSSGTCAADFVMQEKTKFSAVGEYHFTVAQYTRVEQLTGVQSIGLHITEIVNK